MLDGVQVVEEAGEEPEERLLFEGCALFFVCVCKHNDNNGQYLGEVVSLDLVVVLCAGFAVITNNERDKLG
jgi:hypothetical protein